MVEWFYFVGTHMPKFVVTWFDANGTKQLDRFMTREMAERVVWSLRYYNITANWMEMT